MNADLRDSHSFIYFSKMQINYPQYVFFILIKIINILFFELSIIVSIIKLKSIKFPSLSICVKKNLWCSYFVVANFSEKTNKQTTYYIDLIYNLYAIQEKKENQLNLEKKKPKNILDQIKLTNYINSYKKLNY